MLSDCVISTDKPEMALGYKRICRPTELAQDDTPTLPVIQHAVAVYEMAHMGVHVDAVVILQPTSPMRLVEDIDGAIEFFIRSGADSLVSVYEGIHPVKSYDQDGRPFLEQIPYDKHKHKCWTRNGAVFITRRDLLDSGKLVGDNPAFYIMPKSRSFDIDDMEDLFIVESILRKGEIQ